MRAFIVIVAGVLAGACSHQQRVSGGLSEVQPVAGYDQSMQQPIGGVPSAKTPKPRIVEKYKVVPCGVPSAKTPKGKCFVQTATVTQPIAPQANARPACRGCSERQPVAGREACPVARAHFGFDSAVLSAEDKKILDTSADCLLKSGGTLRIRIAGHADERGTQAYNQELGLRRAQSAEEYLVGKGIAREDLDVVSFGKDLPLCTAHNEDCWKLNRRVTVHPSEAAIPRARE